MNPISFKDLKLFKTKEIPTHRSKKNSSKTKEETETIAKRKFIQSPFLYLFVFVIVLAYFLAHVPSRTIPVLEIGEIATSDIIAPSEITITDTERTETRRKEAAETIAPVYTFNANVFLNTEEKVRELFIAGRNFLEEEVTNQRKVEFQNLILENYGLQPSSNDLNALIADKFESTIEEKLINLIGFVSTNFIITSKNLFYHEEQQKGLTVVTSGGTESTLNSDDILDIIAAKQSLTDEVEKLDIPQNEKNLLKNLSQLFIAQNIFYDQVETENRKEQARASEEDVFYTIKKGKVIIRKGDEVDEEARLSMRICKHNQAG